MICPHCQATVLSTSQPVGATQRKVPVLVPDHNSASGQRVEWLSIEVDSDLAKILDSAELPAAFAATPALLEAEAHKRYPQNGGTHRRAFIEGAQWAAAPMVGREIQPHIYMPDYRAMGDCRVCGHGQDKPWHVTPAVGGEMRYRHKKRGSVYRVLHQGMMSTSEVPRMDDEPM